MFSFHKPKIYRSLQGCCICRAKSSSSRFTDSKRYEADFDKCFKIDDCRQGEICNACVLLVKRWKKLPSGSTRNWHHVVDARAGPGTKSITKIKNRVKEQQKEDRKLKKHKHRYQRKPHHLKPVSATAPSSRASSPASHIQPCSPAALSDDIAMGDDLSDHESMTPDNSDMGSDCDEDTRDGFDITPSPQKPVVSRRCLRKPSSPCRRAGFSSFLDLDYWTRTEICCGTIFTGANGELLLDASLWRPCGTCKGPGSQTSAPGSPKLVPDPLIDSPPSKRRQDSECSTESASDDSGLGLVASQDVVKFPTPPDTQPSTPTSYHPMHATHAQDLSNMHHMAAAAQGGPLDLSQQPQPQQALCPPPLSHHTNAFGGGVTTPGHLLHGDMPPPVLEPQSSSPHCIQAV